MSPRTRGGLSDLLSASDLERHENARVAIQQARKLLPGWRATARMLSRRTDMEVKLTAGGFSCTDGKVIHIKVPYELAFLPEHESSICGQRGEHDLLVCPACDILEDVNITVIHEVCHIVFDTFEEMTEYERSRIIDQVIRLQAKGTPPQSRLNKIKRDLDEARKNGLRDYLSLSQVVSPYLPVIINALEDIRVNAKMQEHRPGTRVMFNSQTAKVFRDGIKDYNGQARSWSEAQPNLQAIIGLYCKAGGFDYEHALHPDVVQALDDLELDQLCSQVIGAKSVRLMYNLSIPLLERLRQLGFCKDPEDQQDEPEDNSEDSSEQEQEQDGNQESQNSKESEQTSQGSGSDDQDEQQSDESDTSENETQDSEDHDQSGQASEEDQSKSDSSTGEEKLDEEADTGEDQSGLSDDQESDGGDAPSGDEADGDDTDAEEEGDGDSSDEGEGNPDGSDTGEQSSSDEADGSEGSSGDAESESTSGEDDSSSSEDGDGSGSDRSSEDQGDNGLDERSRESTRTDDPVSSEVDEGQQSSGSEMEEPPSGLDQPEDTEPPAPDDDTDPAACPSPGQDPDTGYDDTGQSLDSPETGDKDGQDPYTSADQERDGTPEDVEELFTVFGRHEDQKASPSEAQEKQDLEDVIEMALHQIDFFDSPSLNISGVNEHKFVDGRAAWAEHNRQYGEHVDVPESVLIPSLQRLRLVFTDNARGRVERNRRSGKVDGRVLAKRAPAGDDRLFKKRTVPGRRDYFVVIGLDCSGSTAAAIGDGHCRLDMMKAAAGAKAELLSRLGISFAMYAHSGSWDAVDIFEIKGPKERWGTKQREALEKLNPYSGNLDGHSLEYYRKVIEKRQETDRLILYYTDGAMPASNYSEELEILQREIKLCERLGIHLVGVGVQSDAPKEHGLDTILLNSVEDIPEVVTQLRKRLM